MIPRVTVLSRPRGLPIAIAHSPGRTLLELPRGATGRLAAATFTTATSVIGSEPSTLPLKLRPSGRVTPTSLVPSTTWALVRITPSERVMKPEPCPCCCCTEGPLPKRPPIGLTTRRTVSMRTTAGPTLSTAFTTKLLPPGSGAAAGASLTWAGPLPLPLPQPGRRSPVPLQPLNPRPSSRQPKASWGRTPCIKRVMLRAGVGQVFRRIIGDTPPSDHPYIHDPQGTT